MRVAITGLKGDFDKGKGSGIQRYMYELYAHTRHCRGDIRIEKVEVDFLNLGNGVSFGLGSVFADYGRYDIVHNLDLRPFFPLRSGNAIKVSTAHDFYNLLAPQLNRHLKSNLKGILWLNLSFRFALHSTLSSDYVIAVSTLVRDDAVKLGYDRNKISVVNLGVDERFRTSVRSERRKEKEFIVGYVGSFATNKNVALLVNAFKKLDSNDALLELWGKKSYEYDTLRGLAGNDGRISFKGFVPEAELVRTYDRFDVFVYPSLYDGFGIPIIEAQSRGLPVIIYKKGKIAKEVRKHCIEADSAEDIAEIIQDIRANGYNQKRRKEAQRYARTFTWNKTARGTLKVYEKLGRK